MADGDAAALPAPDKSSRGRGGLVPLLGSLALVSLVAAGAGAGFGLLQFSEIGAAATKRANTLPVDKTPALAWDEKTGLARLNPIIVNLAAPQGARVRLDTAMVFDRDAVPDVEWLKAELATEILAFLRTVSLGELQGASAFAHLRDDLNQRARAVSSGAVRAILIETMVLQ